MIKTIKTVPQEDLRFPPDWLFQLADGRHVTGQEFRDRYAGTPGRYPIWKAGKRIGVLTNHGPHDPLNDRGITSTAKKLGL